MTDLEKFQAVNKTKSLKELANVIRSFADEYGMIKGRTQNFKASIMADSCERYSLAERNMLTREWEIRQQAMYLIFYNKK